MISSLLYYFLHFWFFFFFQPKEKDSLTFSNLIHKTIPQEAGVLQRQLPTPLCKDNAQQIAAAPGYQKADVYMLLVSGSDWKWWPHGHARGASQPQELPSWWCWNEQLWKSSGKWVSPRIILTGVTILSVPGRKQRSSKLTWRKFSIMCVYVCSVVSDSMRPHGLSPPGSSVHGIFQARIITGMGCHFLPQGIFLTQELNPRLLHWHQHRLGSSNSPL